MQIEAYQMDGSSDMFSKCVDTLLFESKHAKGMSLRYDATFICAFRINRFLKIGFSLFLEAEGGFFWGYGQFHLATLDEWGVP